MPVRHGKEQNVGPGGIAGEELVDLFSNRKMRLVPARRQVICPALRMQRKIKPFQVIRAEIVFE